MVYDARHELLNLVAQARLIPLIEVLLVAVLVLVAQLEVVGLPPWRGNIDIALCARDDEVTLGLYTLAQLERCHSARVAHDASRIDIHPVLVQTAVYVNIFVLRAEQLHNGKQGV